MLVKFTDDKGRDLAVAAAGILALNINILLVRYVDSS